MNNVTLIGRLTRDPDVRATQSGMTIARFSLAVDRTGKDGGADFPNVVCFGKTAENVGRYMGKGRLVGVIGRLQTGSYQKQDGTKVYTTDVIADRVEFLDKAEQQQNNWQNNQQNNQQNNWAQQSFEQAQQAVRPNSFTNEQASFAQNPQGTFQQVQTFGQMQAPQPTQNEPEAITFEEIQADIPF